MISQGAFLSCSIVIIFPDYQQRRISRELEEASGSQGSGTSRVHFLSRTCTKQKPGDLMVSGLFLWRTLTPYD